MCQIYAKCTKQVRRDPIMAILRVIFRTSRHHRTANCTRHIVKKSRLGLGTHFFKKTIDARHFFSLRAVYCCGSQCKLDQLRLGVELVHAFVLQVAVFASVGLCFRFDSSFWSSLFTTFVLHFLNLSPSFGCWFSSSLDICLPLVTCHTCPYPQSYLPTGARAFTQADFCSHYLLACLLVALCGQMVDFGSCVFVTRMIGLFTATSWLLVICLFVSLSHLKGVLHPHSVIFGYLFGCFPHLVAVGKKGDWADPWQKKGNSPPVRREHIPRYCWSANSCNTQRLRDLSSLVGVCPSTLSVNNDILITMDGLTIVMHQSQAMLHGGNLPRSFPMWSNTCPTPRKADLPAGGPHFKVDIRASASSALHGELRKQNWGIYINTTADSSQPTKHEGSWRLYVL